VVERTTFAFLTIQNMTNTKMDTSTRDICTVLSMKSVVIAEYLLREVFMTMMHPALSALWSHVVQCWWCLHGMTVHLDGPRSIMGTWWLHIITTGIQLTLSVLTRTQSMFLVAMLTRMVPCCTLWKEFAAHSRAFHMSAAESWHAPCAPSDGTTVHLQCQSTTYNDPKDSSDLINCLHELP